MAEPSLEVEPKSVTLTWLITCWISGCAVDRVGPPTQGRLLNKRREHREEGCFNWSLSRQQPDNFGASTCCKALSTSLTHRSAAAQTIVRLIYFNRVFLENGQIRLWTRISGAQAKMKNYSVKKWKSPAKKKKPKQIPHIMTAVCTNAIPNHDMAFESA